MDERPRPDPAAGTYVYGHNVMISPESYQHQGVREHTETLCRLIVREKTGNEAQWGKWTHFPATTFTDPETDEEVTLRERWVYTAEALTTEVISNG